jgi:hypothetical protein
MSDQAGGVYRPFPSFVEWEIGGLDTSDFERYAAMLTATKKSIEAATLQAAMTTAQRYAAVDTNAMKVCTKSIEGSPEQSLRRQRFGKA